MNRYEVIRILKEDEGFRSRMYFDTQGIPTIGYGFNLRDSDMPEEIATSLLEIKMDEAERGCSGIIPYWYDLPEQAQSVLVCLAYNMGVFNLLGFHKMLQHLENKEYGAAAEELRDSQWFHQVGRVRSQRMIEMLRNCQ